MAEIRVLDKHTSELIAAGEVVERPSSVAKELLENAIDAGATKITLSIRRGGIQQLQIVDNGSGIEAEYIDKAFIRHATSKIQTAEDLAHIHTLGFRGEALASIASVAKVEVLTRPHRGGRVRLPLPHCRRGTPGHGAGRPPGGHHHHGERPVLQHPRPDEVPQEGFQRGHLCGGCGAAHRPVPPGDLLPLRAGGQAPVRHPLATASCSAPCTRRWAGTLPGTCSRCRAATASTGSAAWSPRPGPAGPPGGRSISM